MKWTTFAILVGASLWVGCGDDKDPEPNDGGNDAGGNNGDGGNTTGGEDGGGAIALDPKADAQTAAESICGLGPWVLGKLSKQELPEAKITNNVRTDQATFVEDKPPVCVNDPEDNPGVCDEDPSGATVFSYVSSGEADAGSGAVQQVWCKSENYSDLTRIAGAEGAKRGECEGLHDLIVAWAEAQLDKAPTRKIVYKADAKERGSEWAPAFVQTAEEGDTLTATSPELHVDTKAIYAAENGLDEVPAFLDDDIFGNHYCKLLSPAAALAWLSGD